MPAPRIAKRPRRCKARRCPRSARPAVISSARVGAFDSVRRGSARTPAVLRHGALALLAALAACFRPDYLDYAACATTESCRDAGLDVCVILPAAPDQPGFCAAECGDDAACPSGQDSDAAPTCLAVGGRGVCALDCVAHTCPSGYVCRAVHDDLDAAHMVCFPGPQEAS